MRRRRTRRKIKKRTKSHKKVKKSRKVRKSRKGGLAKKVRGYKKLLSHSRGKYNEIMISVKNKNKRLHLNITHPSI